MPSRASKSIARIVRGGRADSGRGGHLRRDELLVSRRTREIGIRISLGASYADVLRLVLRQAMLQALTGTVAGVAGAVLLSKLLATMLYAVKPTDPLTFAGV
jgi:hypothetical protein